MRVFGRIAKVIHESENKEFSLIALTVEDSSPTSEEQLKAMGAFGIRKGRNDQNDSYYSTLTIAGKLPVQAIPGTLIEVHGKLSRDSYGPKLKYTKAFARIPQPDDLLGVASFLKNVSLMGGNASDKFVSKYKEKSLHVVEHETHLVCELLRIGQRFTKEIKESFDVLKGNRNITTLLESYGLSPKIAEKIKAKFGNARALNAVQENPWLLASIPGMGFKAADELAMRMGKDPNSVDRLRAGLQHCIETEGGQGHTATDIETLTKKTGQLLSLSGERDFPDRVQSRIDFMRQKQYPGLREIDGVEYISERSKLMQESGIAYSVNRLLKEGPKEDHRLQELARNYIKNKMSFTPDAQQEKAILEAFKSPFLIITGGPGCGKTTITKAIADVAKAGGLEVSFSAPTGKAARRSTQATGFESRTVHSRLRIGNDEEVSNNDTAPKEVKELSGDMFLLDESSMADAYLMERFLSHIPSGKRVLLIGDVDQLPSVGPGAAFGDLIACGHIPVVRLETIHRTAQNSYIASNAHAIIRGDMDDLYLERDGTDFHWMEEPVADRVADAAKLAWKQAAKKYGNDEVQILAPSWKGSAGASAVGHAIRAMLNPEKPGEPYVQQGSVRYQQGDRILFTKNVTKKFSNGETAVLTEVLKARKFDDPVAIATMSDPNPDGSPRRVSLTREDFTYVRQGYAISIHKSQGSEYKAVIVLATDQNTFMLNRNLLYTAVTRGKKEVFLIGTYSALDKALSQRADLRRTGLIHEIERVLGPSPNKKLKFNDINFKEGELKLKSKEAQKNSPVLHAPNPIKVEHASREEALAAGLKARDRLRSRLAKGSP